MGTNLDSLVVADLSDEELDQVAGASAGSLPVKVLPPAAMHLT